MQFSTKILLSTVGTLAVSLTVLLLTFPERAEEKPSAEAVYKGRPTSYWRSVMEWDPGVSEFVAREFPLLKDPDPDAIPVLMELLRDDSFMVQLTAIASLQAIGPKSRVVVPELCRMLRDERSYPKSFKCTVLLEAIDLLADFGSDASEAIPALTDLLSNNNEFLRFRAANALWFITSDRGAALRTLVSLANDSQTTGQLLAVSAMGTLRPVSPEFVTVLTSLLREAEFDSIRADAARSLGKIGKEATNALPALLRALDIGEERVRYKATQAIVRIGDRPERVIPHVLRELKREPLDINYFYILEQLKPASPEVISALVDLIKNPRVSASNVERAKETLAVLRAK